MPIVQTSRTPMYVNARPGDDITSAITGAIDAGRPVMLPPGVFDAAGIVVKNGTHIEGAGPGLTTLRLKAGSSTDLITSESFNSLTGGSTRGGPEDWLLRNLILDGNKGDVTSGYPLRVFGAAYRLDGVEIQNGKSGGVWSEWGTGGTDMEAQWLNVRVHDCNGKGIDWQGPHDSVFTNVMVFKNSTHGFHFRGNSTSEQIANCHVWGTEHDYGIYAESPVYCTNCQVEGATIANVRIKGGNFSFIGGTVFGTGSANEVGFEIGDGTAETIGGTVIQGTSLRAFNGASSFALKLNGATSAGALIDITYYANGAAAAISGTFNDTNSVRILSNDTTARSQESRINVYGRVRFLPATGSTTSTTWKSSDGATDHLNWNSNSQRLEFPNGSDARFFSDNYSTQTLNLDAAGFVEITEATAPSAPSANRVRLFAQDNGAGKTQLMARFNTGAAQQVAIEP